MVQWKPIYNKGSFESMTMNLSQWDDKTEITVEELAGLSPDQRFLADIRDPAAFDRGTAP